MIHFADMTNFVNLCRGLPKKRLKKAAKANTDTSTVVATSASGMQFPHNEAVQKVTHKKRKRTTSSSFQEKKTKGSATNASSTTNTRYDLQFSLVFNKMS